MDQGGAPVIVVDTQVLVYIEIPGTHTDQADALFVRDREWVAPPLWRSEFRNALTGMMRAQGLTPARAIEAFASAARKLGGGEPSPSTSRVFQLAGATRLTAYDLEYVAVAQALGVPLVTYDREILAAFPGLALHPTEYLART